MFPSEHHKLTRKASAESLDGDLYLSARDENVNSISLMSHRR